MSASLNFHCEELDAIVLADNDSTSRDSFGDSAMCNRRSEYVRVIAVVVAPFEFRDVQRQIFAADFPGVRLSQCRFLFLPPI